MQPCNRTVSWWALVVGLTAGLTTACNGATDYPNPPPPGGALQARTLSLRLQERAAERVARHLPEILRAHLPTRTQAGRERAILYVPEDTLGDAVELTPRDGCIGPASPTECPPRASDSDDTSGPTYRSRLELALDTVADVFDVRLLPTASTQAPRLSFVLSDVDVFVDLAAVLHASSGSATCLIKDSAAGQAAVRLTELSFVVHLGVDGNNTFAPTVSDIALTLATVNPLDLDITPCNGGACQDPTCHANNLDFTCPELCGPTPFTGAFVSLVVDVLTPTLAAHVPSLVQTALTGALADVTSLPLQGSMSYGLAQLFTVPSTLWSQPTEISAALQPSDSPYEVSGPSVGRGTSMALSAGLTAQPSLSVPTVSPPNYGLTQGLPPFFDGSLELVHPVSQVARVEAYHAVLSVSNTTLTQALFALFTAGAFSITLSPPDSAALSNGAFHPTLADLPPDVLALGAATTPVYFQIHPTTAPRSRLRDDDASPRPDGTYTNAPYVTVDMGEMGVSAYALLDSGLVRVFTVAADVQLDVHPSVTPSNTIELSLGTLVASNLAHVYGELTAPADVQELVRLVLRLGLGSLVENAPTLSLDQATHATQLLGGTPAVTRINALLLSGGAASGHLSAYLTFCTDTDTQNADDTACYRPISP